MVCLHRFGPLSPSLWRRPSVLWMVGFFFVFTLTGVLTGCGADDPAGDTWKIEDENGEEENNDDENSDAPIVPPSVVMGVDTVVDPATIRAGEILDAECVYFDVNDEPVQLDESEEVHERFLFYPDDAFEKTDDGLVARRAGDAHVACQVPDLGFTDEDPAPVLIEPASVYTTTTSMNDDQIVAGESVSAACEAFDEYGNQIHDADFELVVDTSSSGIVIDNEELSASITTAGIFTFDCHVEGTTQRIGDPVEVVPDKPAELFASPMPDQQVYGIGQVITISTIVQDRFGNRISDAPTEFDATPPGEAFGTARYRFDSDGTYMLSAEVTGETNDDVTLYEEFEVVVNGMGPFISCSDPFDGEMIDHGGNSITFNGKVADNSGIDEVLVNDEPVSVDGKGDFSATVDTRYGINFVDVTATDTYGEENVRTCAFMTSENWVPEEGEGAYIDDAVSLSLFQDAIDDDNYQGANNIRSLNDLLITVLRSQGLEDEIEQQIKASGTFSESAAYCTFDISVTGIDFPNASHATALTLIGGGLTLESAFSTIQIHLNIDSGWGCPGGSPTMTVDWIDIDLTSNINKVGYSPSFTLGNVDRVESGEVSLSGGWSVLSYFFQGTFREMVEDLFEDAIKDNFDTLFGGLMDSLGIIETSFDIPRLDSDDTMTLDFESRFSTVDVSSSRALFGLEPRITPELAGSHGITSLGAPYPSGAILRDLTGNSAAAAAHISLLNQALHALWRGGLFHADVGGSLGDDLPDGVAVELAAKMPPMLVLENNSGAELMLGAVELNLQYPGIFDEPVTLMVGVTASTDVSLTNDELNFGDIQIEEFHLSALDVSLNSGTRDVLEDFLSGLFQDIFDQSLNSGLPTLPIPSFAVPASMGNYNLTAGDEIGIFDTSLSQTNRHFEIHGNFGIE